MNAMKTYVRIMSASEKIQISKSGVISLNANNWLIYPPDKVVFLFDATVASMNFMEKVAKAHCETNQVETWLLCFQAFLISEPDVSQSGWDGAVVVSHPIPLSSLHAVSWKMLYQWDSDTMTSKRV